MEWDSESQHWYFLDNQPTKILRREYEKHVTDALEIVDGSLSLNVVENLQFVALANG